MADARPPWNELPPIPEARGSAQKQARRKDVWRSVITQQYQADILAVKMAAQLLNLAEHHEARLYYTTMAQDEARHVEAWLKLLGEVGGRAREIPISTSWHACSWTTSTCSRRRSSSCRFSSSA